MEDANRELLSVPEVARLAGMMPVELDIDSLLIDTKQLPVFLQDFIHYNMSLLDLPDRVAPDHAYASAIEAVGALHTPGVLVLDRVSDADVFIESHDDCYVYVETRSRTHVMAHFARLLQEFVAAELSVDGLGISPPAPSLLDEVLSASGTCAMFDVHSTLKDGVLRLGYSTVGYRLGNPAPAPTALLVYDLAQSQWAAG
jgi:hypothetical protein